MDCPGDLGAKRRGRVQRFHLAEKPRADDVGAGPEDRAGRWLGSRWRGGRRGTGNQPHSDITIEIRPLSHFARPRRDRHGTEPVAPDFRVQQSRDAVRRALESQHFVLMRTPREELRALNTGPRFLLRRGRSPPPCVQGSYGFSPAWPWLPARRSSRHCCCHHMPCSAAGAISRPTRKRINQLVPPERITSARPAPPNPAPVAMPDATPDAINAEYPHGERFKAQRLN